MKTVTIIGLALVQTVFTRYLKMKHGKYSRNIWDMQVLYTTIVAKIDSKYKQIQRKRFGNVSVVEMYTTTEGAFSKQMDENPYWSLNYDRYFSETNGETKMLYELEKSEGSRLYVPTPLFLCYRIRAFMEAKDKNYFSIFWER